MQADFEVRDKTGRRLAVVDAKARRGVTSSWAQQTYELLDPPRDALFVLATPGAVYFWQPGVDLGSPTHEVVAAPLLQPYLARVGLSAEDFIAPEVFPLVVQSWLLDVVAGRVETPPEPSWLAPLVDRLRGGVLETDVAA